MYALARHHLSDKHMEQRHDDEGKPNPLQHLCGVQIGHDPIACDRQVKEAPNRYYPVVFIGLARRWNLALGALCTLPLELATIFSGAIVPSALAQLQGFRPEQIAPALTEVLWPQLISYTACIIVLSTRLMETR
jgi:hypothetical protein